MHFLQWDSLLTDFSIESDPIMTQLEHASDR
jgi:hypothetical protein